MIARAMRTRIPRTLLLLSFLLPLGPAGCSNDRTDLYMTVERYLAAVMQRDARGMAAVWAPFRREAVGLDAAAQEKKLQAFQAEIKRAHDSYEAAKQDGMLAPDPLGVSLFRALNLGKGAGTVPLSYTLEDGGRSAKVRTRIVTSLETLRLEALPDGVRVYLMGYPLGRLETIVVGFDAPENHDLLGSVDIDWRLSRDVEGMRSSTRWLIESFAADPASAVKWERNRPGT